MKIYTGKSKLHGKGLFTSRNIKKGETVFIIKGKEVNFIITNNKKARPFHSVPRLSSFYYIAIIFGVIIKNSKRLMVRNQGQGRGFVRLILAK